MNRITFLLALLSTLLFSSCFDIVEDIYINKKGNHKYTLTFDMNNLMVDPMLKDAVLESLKKEAGMSLDEQGRLAVDSTSYFKDDPKFKAAKISKKVKESAKLHMLVNEAKEQMILKIDFEFEDVSEIATFFDTMKDSEEMGKTIGEPSLFVFGGKYKMGKKNLKRLPSPKNELGDVEGMEMIKMMMSNATYTTNYYLPGKVKKSDFNNSRFDNKRVTVINSLVDVMENKVDLTGEIKFKK